MLDRLGPDASDEVLMCAYVDNDNTAAFNQLFKRYAQRIHRLYLSRGLSDADARDLVQQTFLNLHRSRADYRRGKMLRPWLFTIAYNLMRDAFRKRGHRITVEVTDDIASDNSTSEGEIIDRERARSIRNAVADLPAKQREVIELHWFSELSFPDISKVLGVGLSAVKVRAHRGYQRLKKSLETL